MADQIPLSRLIDSCVEIGTRAQEDVHVSRTYRRTDDVERDLEPMPQRSEERVEELLDDLRRQLDSGHRRTNREAVAGMPPIEADVSSHRQIRSELQDEFPDLPIAGEEGEGPDWTELMSAPPGSFVVTVDSIDGSWGLETSGACFSTNFCIYRRGSGRIGDDRLLAHVVLSSNGRNLVYEAPSKVWVGHRGRKLTQRTDFLYAPDEVRPGSVATVAVQPHHLNGRLAVLWDSSQTWGLPSYVSGGRTYQSPPLSPFGAGGAPLFVEMICGRLDNIVIPHPQTGHDAAGLLSLPILGAHCFAFDGRPITVGELREAFNIVDRPKGKQYNPIPEMVVSRDATLGQLIAERLGASGAETARLRAVPTNDVTPRLRIVKDEDLEEDGNA